MSGLHFHSGVPVSLTDANETEMRCLTKPGGRDTMNPGADVAGRALNEVILGYG
jgi:hypothetical protein